MPDEKRFPVTEEQAKILEGAHEVIAAVQNLCEKHGADAVAGLALGQLSDELGLEKALALLRQRHLDAEDPSRLERRTARGEKLDILMTVLGECQHAEIDAFAGSEYWLLRLYMGGDLPDSRAIADLEGREVAVVQVHNGPVGLADADG